MSRRTTNTTVDLVAASILLAAVMVATACSAPPSPKVTAPPVVTTTAPAPAETPLPQPTPTPQATWPPQMALPTPPPEMSRDDETGAVAAATYFLTDLYTYTERTQDTASWVAMSHAECIFCKSVLEDIAEQRLGGRVAVVAPIRIGSTSVKSLNPLMFSMTAEIATGPDQEFAYDGTLLGTTAEDTGTATVIVVRRDNGWLTRGVELSRHV